MDEAHKNAYRYLLYHAMLNIRGLQWLSMVDLFKPWRFLWRLRQIRRAGSVADLMHNAALFAATDFDGFDEGRFWDQVARFQASCPEMYNLRNTFDQFVAEQRSDMSKSAPS